MQDVTFTFTEGPMKGSQAEFEVGQLLIGRQPGTQGLELKYANQSVSRVHAELFEEDGEITLRNHSQNGTLVAGKLVLDTVPLSPGTKIQVGDSHVFEVRWTTFTAAAPKAVDTQAEQAGQKKKGALASPVVRALIGLYLVGIIGVVVWISGTDSGGAVTDDWPALSAEYANYQPAGVPEDVLAARAERAQDLLQRLRVLKTQNRRTEIEAACRELMSLDGDVRSPLYRYGAACVGRY